jgi:hypothetical protein
MKLYELFIVLGQSEMKKDHSVPCHETTSSFDNFIKMLRNVESTEKHGTKTQDFNGDQTQLRIKEACHLVSQAISNY